MWLGVAQNQTHSNFLWASFLPAKLRIIHSKIKVLECHNRSPIVSLCNFYDSQGKLTPQSEVCSTLNSSSAKRLRLSLLPVRVKKIKSKMKALEWSQHYTSIFKMLKDS